MSTKNELTPEQSFKIINEMIQATKVNIGNYAFYFLMWGWVIISGCVLNYVFLQIESIKKPHRAWFIVILGIILSIIHGFKLSKRGHKITHLTKVYIYLWWSMCICYLIVIIYIARFNYQIYPLIFIFLGNATFISGIILKFKPLLIGGIISWVSSIISFYLSNEYNLLLSAIAHTSGYLIPGYMLKRFKE